MGIPRRFSFLRHGHELGVECECAQYAQDHSPAHSFNTDES